MNYFRKLLLAAIATFAFSFAEAQITLPFEVHGNFQVDAQYYLEDSVIGAPVVPEKVLMNGFGNLTFSRGNFNAGLRYESYLNPLLGFDSRYKGSGITYRYATYTVGDLEITLGNFYDQFGSGLIFRSYEERGLGIDNAMDGIRLKYNPWNGIYLKGFIAEQRSYFEKGPGIVRGIDGEVALTEAIKSIESWKTKITVGGSVVSKYQNSNDPVYNIPENVLSYATRLLLNRGNYRLYAEYAYKYNDPSLVNATAENPAGIYKPGQALFLNGGYSKKGIGVSVSAKYIDNMSFRSDRNATGNDLNLSYLPATTKQQTYRLATLYPYATQPNGEVGFMGEVFYKFKKGSLLGGENGMNLAINYSRANGLDTVHTNDEMGYESDFFKPGDVKYFEEINVELIKDFSRDFKMTLTYIYTLYDEGVIKGLGSDYGTIYASIGVAEFQYKLNKTNTIRTELQHLWTKQPQDVQPTSSNKGNWAMVLVEYSISPNWFFSVFDEFNYGNNTEAQQLHYPNVSMGFTKGANRISLGYGKQREGLLCVGGVCRNVPASNGFSIGVTSSF